MTETLRTISGGPGRTSPRPVVRRRRLTTDEIVDGVLAGNRTILSRAITLVESRNPDHFKQAQNVLACLMPNTGGAHRIGITGVPGVGKSTFIEAFGKNLTGLGKKVAVLAVDPTSARSGGSILGDKTRMNELSIDPNAYIRPSPSSGYLGGVNRMTRETILLCEAAGFDVVLVETVGAGQSETMVAQMTDFFLVLMLPGAGDELQGIKKGVLEIADVIAVNKSDADPAKAREAKREYSSALRILQPTSKHWRPQSIMISSLTREGLDQVWDLICQHRQIMETEDEFAAKRSRQQHDWMRTMLRDRLLETFTARPDVAARLQTIEIDVLAGIINPTAAVEELLRMIPPPESRNVK
ncbi:methylmalonyl Co-A mutase-associated GTPase MeaB [Thalassospira sp.]|uniref:methylmalonyl Co-A mutase-associated GTPase MeaB n=1 Tax=Thalassospira sp. TaxID=1912094 RepID=UPI002732D043|nr:methylmalonyl Co-A mutase-associated GTPase MeaB [Thalassospira sp.]MDP2698893.1 methylmalonyl Co-A mutase-associated GTPase MeaB [Thalassospira sp.]